MTLIVIFAFIFGTIYGSFLNVLLWRLPEGRGISGRSHCRSCDHQLAWYDLVPIFSFVALRGRCRYCHENIHFRYPIVEIATGLVLATFFFQQTSLIPIEAVITVLGLLALVTLFFFDFFYMILPDFVILPASIMYALYDYLKPNHPLPYFLSALLLASFFAILYVVSHGKNMGFGDVKLAFLIGLILGYPIGFMAIVGGIWLAAIVAMILLVSKRVGLKDPLPLGSFLSISTIICVIFYHEILPFTWLFK